MHVLPHGYNMRHGQRKFLLKQARPGLVQAVLRRRRESADEQLFLWGDLCLAHSGLAA